VLSLLRHLKSELFVGPEVPPAPQRKIPEHDVPDPDPLEGGDLPPDRVAHPPDVPVPPLRQHESELQSQIIIAVVVAVVVPEDLDGFSPEEVAAIEDAGPEQFQLVPHVVFDSNIILIELATSAGGSSSSWWWGW